MATPSWLLFYFIFNDIMQLVQSYIFSVCRSSLSLYEQRIVLRIVEFAQTMLADVTMRDVVGKQMSVDDNVKVTLSLRDIMCDDDKAKHYEYVRDAFSSLLSRKVEFWDTDRKIWYGSSIIYNCSIVKASGRASFYVSRVFLCALLDFTKGYCKYDLQVALSLKSPYSVRLFMLLCNQTHPVEFSISQLKRMLCQDTDAYKQSADFIKRVIEPSRRELDAKGCNSFTVNKVSGAFNKTVALVFHPVKRAKPDALRAQVSTARIIDRHLWIILSSQAGFSYRELSAHKSLWEGFQAVPDCLSIALDIVGRARAANKTKGWIIQAIRAETEKFKHE